MKKFCLLVCLALLALACTENNVSDVITQKENNNMNSIRSFDEALEIARSAIEMIDNTNKTRSGSSRRIDMSNCRVCKTDTKTRTSTDINDTLIYVFNFEDNEGFALVSASKETDGLLAITEKGNFDPDTPSPIKGFNQFIEKAKRFVALSIANKDTVPTRAHELPFKDSIVYSSIVRGPYVTVNWGQFYPEGEFCPNGIAGCTNVALAQIMSYYSHPSSINLTYPNADVPTQTLNWSQIRTHLPGHNLANCQPSDTATHKAIGRLLRQLGRLTWSSYVNDFTITMNNFLQQASNSLGYMHNWSSNLTQNVVKGKLDSLRLILVNGSDNNNTGGGHSWVLDGYRYITATHYYYERAGTYPNEWLLVSITNTYTYLYHFNWGWYGECNGLFNNAVYYNPIYSFDGLYDIDTGDHDHTFTLSNSFIMWPE